MITGTILPIQRLSTEDGPGIRTTVFLKGCPLHCSWCHNPESISSQLQTQWFAGRCLNCGTCINTCPNNCLSMTEDVLVIDRDRCQACGKCAEACPSGALEALGKTLTVDELVAELLKDRAYYEASTLVANKETRGGVTLSGGEPTFQPDFAEALLKGLKAHGIATALDTCGLTSTDTLNRLLPFTDLVLFDLKVKDPVLHQEFTGVSNQRILENLIYIRDYQRAQPQPFELWIRTPLIPGATSFESNLHAIGKFLAENLDGSISRWELCAFNNLCREQYTRLGLEWAYSKTPLLTDSELVFCKESAQASGFCPDLIVATGLTRSNEPQ